MARDLVESLKHLSWRAAKEGLRRRGYDVVARTHESPIPDTAAIPAETWDPSELVGLDLRLDAAWALLEDELAPFIRQFPPVSTSPTAPTGALTPRRSTPSCAGPGRTS